MFWVVILRCADGSYYTSHTANLERCIGQYQAGECKGYAVTRRPVELAWSQECVTRKDALSAELQIKGWSRKKKEAMMRGDWTEVCRLAKSKSANPSTGSQETVFYANIYEHFTTSGKRPSSARLSEKSVSCSRLASRMRGLIGLERTDLPLLREVES